jgi:putative transposase
MNKSTNFRTGRNCVFNMHVHLVFITKYRRFVFTKQILKHLKNVFLKVCRDFKAELIELDGEKDHIHLLINYPPKVSISKLVNSLKGVSSRLIRKKNTYPLKKLFGANNFGLQVTLLDLVAALLFLKLDNILKNKDLLKVKRQAPSIPALKDRVLSASFDKIKAYRFKKRKILCNAKKNITKKVAPAHMSHVQERESAASASNIIEKTESFLDVIFQKAVKNHTIEVLKIL